MSVEAWGGPHDGATVEISDGTWTIRVPVATRPLDYRELSTEAEPTPDMVTMETVAYPIQLRGLGVDVDGIPQAPRRVVAFPEEWSGR